MQRLRSVFTIAWLITAASCSDAVSPRNDELTLNRQRWNAGGYRDYTMVMRRACFCGEIGPYKVIVVNDSIVSATLVSTGRPADARFLPTITELFDFIEKAIDANAARIDVQYDPTLGYPREVIYDASLNIADEELFYTLSDVKRLTQ